MPKDFTLTLIETSGIQEYVFATNILGVNIGASELVNQLTGDWLAEALPHPHNLRKTGNDTTPDSASDIFADLSLQAEVVYCGGGNALVILRGMEEARAFAARLSETVLLRAPMLDMHIWHEEFDRNESIGEVFENRLIPGLQRLKNQRQPSLPMLGLSVTAQCVFSGHPANFFEKTNPADANARYLSIEVKSKLDARGAAEARLRALAPRIFNEKFDFVYEFDDFGTPGVSSYIGVIHIDGNGMGKRFADYTRDNMRPDQNREWIEKERDFSEEIKRTSTDAIRHVFDVLLSKFDSKSKSWRRPTDEANAPSVNAREKNGKILLPLRPIVFGGDDVTLVADGRLGIAIAKAYLEHCAQSSLPDGKPLHSRAGIAVVHAHYPFSRAYDLAGQLADSVKKEKSVFGYPHAFTLDWHFATSSPLDPLAVIREAEYEADAGKLILRPLSACPSPAGAHRAWQTFVDQVDLFQTDPDWAAKRGKLKALREALRDGPDAVNLFRRLYLKNAELPFFDTQPDFRRSGWHSDRCGYFDSLEAADFYVPLGGE